MSETVALEIPDELARRARALADATHRRFEDVVVDSLRRAVEEPAVETMPDASLLALCDATLGSADQDALHAATRRPPRGFALGRRSGTAGRTHGGIPAGVGPQGAGLKEAVARGLRPSLADDAA